MRKMKNKHVKDYFLDWFELKLNNNKVKMIENHLEECNECRVYYDKVQNMLNNPDTTNLPKLQPDLFLPTRIKELAKGQKEKHKILELLKSKIQVSFSTAIIIFGLGVGIFLGKWISNTNMEANTLSETEIISSYSSMFSDEGLGQVWSNFTIENNGENQ